MVMGTKSVPEVTLELLRGPEPMRKAANTFSVEAVATGNPAPEITFNRYDDPEEVGGNRVTLLLERGKLYPGGRRKLRGKSQRHSGTGGGDSG